MASTISAGTTSGTAIAIAGDTTGNLAFTTQAGTYTQTLPNATGTVMVSGNMPAFSAYGNADQVIANTTYTKVQYNVKSSPGFDTNSCYDTSNYRFTPTVAGYYLINAYTEWQGSASTALRSVNLYKNGSAIRRSQTISYATSGNTGNAFTGMVYLNGSTDYVEIYVVQATGGNLSIYNGNGSNYNWFEGYLARLA